MSAPVADGVLVERHVLDFPGGYTRSVGPAIGRFLTSVRDDAQLLGVRLADGRVLVPPVEYDPSTSAATGDDFVPVGPGGEVTTWTWVARPRPEHPLDHPFAFALIRLDGADTSLLHAVDAGKASAMRSGMRVIARFADERRGHIGDLWFEPHE